VLSCVRLKGGGSHRFLAGVRTRCGAYGKRVHQKTSSSNCLLKASDIHLAKVACLTKVGLGFFICLVVLVR
jgi:hypothetical protein